MSERALRIPALRLGLKGGRIGLVLGLILLAGFILLGLSAPFVDLPPPEKWTCWRACRPHLSRIRLGPTMLAATYWPG